VKSTLKNGFFAASLLMNGIACGPAPVHDDPLPIKKDAGQVTDGGVADASLALNECSLAGYSDMSCQAPSYRRLAYGEIFSAGRYYASFSGLSFDSLGIPQPSIRVMDENCDGISQVSIPEGDNARISNPGRGIALAVFVRMASGRDSADKWSDVQLQDESCPRDCTSVTQASAILNEGGVVNVDTESGRRSFKLNSIDRYAHGIIMGPDDSALWAVHLPPHNNMTADFWDNKLIVNVLAIDFAGKRAQVSIEWQKCTKP
jgi:hypothetical protein